MSAFLSVILSVFSLSVSLSLFHPVCLSVCLLLEFCFHITIVAVSQSKTLTRRRGETRILRSERPLETGWNKNLCWVLVRNL